MIHYLVIILVSLGALIHQTQCYIQYVPDTGNCGPQYQSLGTAEFCCDGVCLDGTELNHPGFCGNWFTPCIDIPNTPSCGSTQAMHGPSFNATWVVTGGPCYQACLSCCSWSSLNWRWSCCDCPPGYVGAVRGTCGVGTYGSSSACARCTDSREQLVGNGYLMSCVIPASTAQSFTTTTSGSGKSTVSSSTASQLATSGKKSTSTRISSTSASSSSTINSSRSSSLLKSTSTNKALLSPTEIPTSASKVSTPKLVPTTKLSSSSSTKSTSRLSSSSTRKSATLTTTG